MRTIELNKIHETKLLEMCDDLFSEYENFNISGKNIIYTDVKDIKQIYWLELCLLELPKRIAENSNSVLTDSMQYKIYESMSKRFLNIHPTYNKLKIKHPVDYLYQEFKKI